MSTIGDLDAVAASGRSLTIEEAERVAACPDLPSVGMLGELARTARHERRVTYVRVAEIAPDAAPVPGEAGEVRLVGAPQSVQDATSRVQAAVAAAAGTVVTGFSLDDLWQLAGRSAGALRDVLVDLRSAGLDAIAEAPLDALGGDAETAVRAVLDAGLAVRCATIHRALFAERMPLIRRAADVQRETGAFHAFAPLPKNDPREEPATGYDDVRTIALARLVCGNIPSIQVDWVLYGPKLAQVAITYGADDIDRIGVEADPDLGRRRSPKEDIERHIRMAFAEPVERDGRFEARA